MDLNTALSKVYTTKWSYISNFRCQINFADKLRSIIGWNSNSDMYDVYIKDLTTPQFSNSPIEVYMGGRWYFHVGRDEIYNFNITFRDAKQMSLYRTFLMAYFSQQTMYFDDCKCNVRIFKDADYADESEILLYDIQDCLISSVSQVNFSNETEAQIAEFSVDFKSATPIFSANTVKQAVTGDKRPEVINLPTTEIF